MKITKNLCFFSTMILLSAAVFGACSGQSPTTTGTSTTPGATTAGQLAASGQTLFATYCAKCHGTSGGGGTGPAIIGSTTALSKYHTAQGLLDFIDVSMPFDAPGTLSHTQYLQLLAFLLVQNSDMTSGAAFNESGLANITLN